MEKIKEIIEDLSVAALEENTKIAGASVISDSGKVIYQTENFDLRNQGNNLINVMKGESSFFLNNDRYTIIESSSDGIIAENDGGMGFLIITPFQGGFLVAYSLPGSNTRKNLSFLKSFGNKIENKL